MLLQDCGPLSRQRSPVVDLFTETGCKLKASGFLPWHYIVRSTLKTAGYWPICRAVIERLSPENHKLPVDQLLSHPS